MQDQQIIDRLSAVFAPRGVVIVGASNREGSIGQSITSNLIKSVQKRFNIYLVNPKYSKLYERECFKEITHVKAKDAELVIFSIPGQSVVALLEDDEFPSSVKAIVVIAAGFKELGPEGAALEQRLVNAAKKRNVAVIGPNCLGIQSPHNRLNGSFADGAVKSGSIAFLSQSGAICSAVIDWARKTRLGFSCFFSLGSMCQVKWHHLLTYLASHSPTQCIFIYMESIGDCDNFIKAARRCSAQLKKPIYVLKCGKSEKAAKAALSHTGSLAGSHVGFEAAMRKANVTILDSLHDLNNVMLLKKCQVNSFKSVKILTNAGGPGVICTDACVSCGLDLAPLSSKEIQALNAICPPAWSHDNPIDILGDASPKLYGAALTALIQKGSNECAIILLLTPQSVTDPTTTAKEIVQVLKTSKTSIPIVCVFEGGQNVEPGRKYLLANGVAVFEYPEQAVKALSYLKVSDMTVGPTGAVALPRAVADLYKRARDQKISVLSETMSRSAFSLFGLDVEVPLIAKDHTELCNLGISYETKKAVKLNSSKITHKSDVSGVVLNVITKKDLLKAFDSIKGSVPRKAFEGVSVQTMITAEKKIELIVGGIIDPIYGPLVTFGFGGCLVEVVQDTATACCPLNKKEASALIKSTKIGSQLFAQHKRLPKISFSRLVTFVEKFSNFIAASKSEITECEINPLLATEQGLHAIDGRIVLSK